MWLHPNWPQEDLRSSNLCTLPKSQVTTGEASLKCLWGSQSVSWAWVHGESLQETGKQCVVLCGQELRQKTEGSDLSPLVSIHYVTSGFCPVLGLQNKAFINWSKFRGGQPRWSWAPVRRSWKRYREEMTAEVTDVWDQVSRDMLFTVLHGGWTNKTDLVWNKKGSVWLYGKTWSPWGQFDR